MGGPIGPPALPTGRPGARVLVRVSAEAPTAIATARGNRPMMTGTVGRTCTGLGRGIPVGCRLCRRAAGRFRNTVPSQTCRLPAPGCLRFRACLRHGLSFPGLFTAAGQGPARLAGGCVLQHLSSFGFTATHIRSMHHNTCENRGLFNLRCMKGIS